MYNKFIMVLLIIGLITVVGVATHAVLSTDTYSGEVTLTTPEEHAAFMQAIGKSEVKTEGKLNISSESPTNVEFSVFVPKGYEFPYGEKGIYSGAVVLASVFGALLVILSIVGAVELQKRIAARQTISKEV